MNDNKSYIFKANSPAALAEEYIIKSIWNNTYPPHTYLPAERELADTIGVTRTTLREVLQRLAREGWLTIQHGKPTLVNNIWETGGTSVVEKLFQLDKSMAPFIIADILSLRTRMSDFYIPKAIKINPEGSLAIFEHLDDLEDTGQAYTEFDYHVFRSFTVIAEKPVYGLIFNSFKGLYNQIGGIYFNIPEGRKLARDFYYNLKTLCQHQDVEKVKECIKVHREQSGMLWNEILSKLQTTKSKKQAGTL
ncbi:fatty acid metabolism transcriptional regulator FadR [Pasteurella skyensis]|uniref:Fatty acid metabolism regulator protein n=1 Tax=Phocoenobacter skyensis TaxID=97481 RepID=A0AAJ6N9I2_9PAST|nr:fatty acid metabolism transcriptional regulator FadR [Pasteurella skyensis]MDP8162232.1 fatty acid metabolism transcriptional regulator FadR [Pasteurella skyensis]MDP8172696.1 fatty acid metabolism transcriptional regulator FadR [Pasteurella skyensis]MDP8179196.1 fatty acid metabolism transcriptional regulator FadR [Pasteurella skyensis]MDP8183349.1 fatty acid metabolism transcriptional regulator FadR [Pasteurella skyensis]MDP8188996.1 fatty acid metabolism transcriptional regulator FadR [P